MLNALSTSPAFAAVFLAANVGAALLLGRQALGAGVARGRLAAGVAGAVVWVAASLALRSRIPADAVTVLQEGFAGDVLTRLAGQGLHGLPGQAVVVRALAGGGHLRDVVGVNVALTGVLALVLAALAARLAGRWGLLLVLGWAVAPITLSAALSTEASPLVGLYTALATLPVTGRWGLGGAARAATAVLLAALATAVRPEVGIALGIAAATVVAVEAAPVPAARAQAAWGRLVDAASRGAGPLVVIAVVVAWVLLAVHLEPWTSSTLPVGHLVAGLARALHPLNVAWVTAIPMALAVLPVGIVLLALVGWARAARWPATTGAVALALPLAFQAWHGAAHGVVFHFTSMISVTELFRYLGQATPVGVLLAAFGAAGLRRWRGVVPVLAALALVPPLAPIAGRVSKHRPGDDPRVAALPAVGLADADLQREVRAALGAMDTNPGCALRTRGRKWGSSPTRPAVEDVALVPGPRGPRLFRADPGELPPLDAPCTLVLVPLDCGLAGGQVGCAGLVPPGSARLHAATFPAAPWVYADHTGGWAGSTQSFELWRAPAPGVAAESP